MAPAHGMAGGGRDRRGRAKPVEPEPHDPRLPRQREGLGENTGTGDPNYSPCFSRACPPLAHAHPLPRSSGQVADGVARFEIQAGGQGRGTGMSGF